MESWLPATLRRRVRVFTKACVGSAAVVAALLTPSLAPAATAYVLGESGHYQASPGEANDVTVTQNGQDFHIVDLGAPITAGDGCQSVSEHEVTCTFAVSAGLEVLLGDLDDSFSASDMTTAILLYGRAGDDTIRGGTGPDWFQGGGGDDTIRTGPGADPGEEQGNTALGGQGNDTLIGGPHPDVLRGEAGDDVVDGNRGRDAISGGHGHDVVSGGRANDTVRSGEGHDTISGNNGNDRLYARDGLHDTVKGGPGFDYAHLDRGLDSVSSIEAFF
jgi:Ca2+-binding RTX toxin-like protein